MGRGGDVIITSEWLRDKRACAGGRRWFEAQTENDVAKITEKLIEADRLDWANWLLARVLTRRQRVQCAVFAAEQVLHLFEEQGPEDMRPRNAIEAAKKWLKDESSAAAADAAADAAYAAASREIKVKILKFGIGLIQAPQ